ncbi:TetR family transcriptional regulator [Vibrio mimicus CAIM 1883]|nr:TetR family transcriptional regulator [Vibrio mimicus CAIM 1883]ERM63382.1 TetR family transcriptional regulator [Vibrio mimicus CAIM 1882]
MISKMAHCDKQLQILIAAEKLIAEQGFQGLSMHKVAKEVNVATGTIYLYFRDKDHLLTEVRLHVSQRIADAVQANIQDDMSLQERFRTMWLNIWTLAGSSRDIISNRVQYESLPTTTCCNVRELEQKMFAKVELLFDQGKQQGLFKPLDNHLLSALSFETTVTLARQYTLGFYQLDDSTLDAMIQASWDAITQH